MNIMTSRVSNDCSQKTSRLAFEESVRAITSLYEGPWRGKQEIITENALSLTMEVSSGAGLSTRRF